jgi:glyoxylase-like metal-dependent hydrolase (beta-lactamase superfamily II)
LKNAAFSMNSQAPLQSPTSMNRRTFLFQTAAAASAGVLLRPGLFAQAPAAAPAGRGVAMPAAIEFKPLRRNVGMFTARGGAIGWLNNSAGLAAVDTQFADTAARFLAEFPGRNDRMFDVLINSHHHGDHTGGNAVLRPVSRLHVGHANVPELMRAAGARGGRGGAAPATPPPPPVVPDTTFTDTWRTEIGDEVIAARYFGAAHTRGDIAVHFERANVVHLGDLCFNRIYPVIDRASGGTFRGWITVAERIAAAYPADTIYIFGHSHATNPQYTPQGTRADLLRFRDYLSAVVAHTQREITAGKTREQIITLTNLDGFEDFHVQANSRLPGNLGAAFDELSAPPAQ